MLLTDIFHRHDQLLDEFGFSPPMGYGKHSSELANVSEVGSHACMLQSAQVATDPFLDEYDSPHFLLSNLFPFSGLPAQLLDFLLSFLLDGELSSQFSPLYLSWVYTEGRC